MAIKKTITLGLINIPVLLQKMFTNNKISFSLVDKKTNQKISYVKHAGDKIVDNEEVTKALKYNDTYIDINQEELKKAAGEEKSLNIIHFCLFKEIPHNILQRVYYLSPAKGAERPFVLLFNQLQAGGQAGIVKMGGKQKEELGIICADSTAMYLYILYYHDEINPAPAIPEIKLSANEKQLAKSLINKMVKKFDHRKYNDSVAASIQQLIKNKAKNKKERKVTSDSKVSNEALSLMNALSKSLQRNAGA